jgi:prepilin-type N-terminal cleavage/methylation domain-containing protein
MRGCVVRQQGFTVLEIMIAVVIVTIGLVAMMAMQVVFVEGGSAARDITMANRVGESAIEQLRAEAVMWSGLRPTADAVTQPSLSAVMGSPNEYRLLFGRHAVTPTMLPRYASRSGYVDGHQFAFESASINARYCVEARGEFLDPGPNTILVGQVRVSWRNDGELPWTSNANAYCSDANNLDGVLFPGGYGGEPAGNWNFVHIPFSIQRHNY